MRALEILLERRWILKSREKELYYQIKDELGTVKKFLMEKLGYQVIVNPYLVKVEKMPATPENWMGIQEFTRKIEYVFFCMILMFLEEKEAEEQFVLSELTEYIQGQYREEQIDWTVYQYRRHLIKVIKYCVNCGILNLNDGSEENFARDDTSEVLYENTGVSRYFMKNFTQDIMGYTTPEDQAEKESLSDSDTVKLKQREVEIKSQLEGLKKNITGKQRQEEEKKEKYQETEQKIQLQFQKNEMLWEEIENSLEYMEEEMAGVPFDEFAFMKKELTEQKGEQYSFQAHSELLKDYMTKVRLGKTTLEEEKGCQERYSRFLQELDSYQEEKNKAEREVLQYENQFHEVKQETIESVYRWEKENAELHLQSDLLQEMAREIEKYTTETDYWNIRGLANGEFERKSQELSGKVLQQSRELSDRRLEKDGICEELEQWKNQKEPEPERSEAVEKNRRLLKEKGIPYLQLYKVIDFDGKLDETQRAYLEEALLHMGILDALIVPEEYREQALALDAGVCDRYIFSDAAYVRNNIMDFLDVDNEEGDILLYQNVSRILTAIGWKEQDEETISESIEKNRTWIDKRGNYGIGIIEGTVTKNYTPCFIGAYAREQYRIKKIQELEAECRRLEDTIQIAEDEITQLKQRKSCLETEWKSFPKEQDLKVAAKELEKKTNILEEIECKVQIQKGIVEKERKSLDAVRLRVQEVCQKCYLPPRLDVFTEAEESLTEYKEELMKVQISYGNYRNGISSAKVQKEYLEGIDADLDDIRYDLNHMIRNERAEKICRMFMGRFGNKRHSEILENLQNVYHMNRGYLLEYQVTLQSLFEELDEESGVFDTSMRRIDISAKYRGITIKFKELIARMKEDAEVQRRLLSDKDRELFEDILANTISKKIRGKIQASKRWVEKMNTLMESMKTSSGLTLSLRWKNKRAEKEEQLDTRELVELLQKDAEIMRPEEAQQLSGHFRSKIEEARKSANDLGNVQSFHAIMRNVLDYRQWFEFQLECQKTGEKKRELTDRVFFTFSGGEKAMSMYVPLFSAVVAKYAGARQDAPYLISLDEAFAGVDEMNIRDMFRLMVKFDFNFMINSQILWGDYDTVPALAIYQLVRPENAKYVTVIRYVWNGNIKSMVTEKDLSHG